MKYLIFRNDRVGDFLITAPLIKSIKRNNPDSHISIVSSEKNYKFIMEINLVDKIFILNTKKKFDKIKLILELKKYIFDTIIVADKKNRSIIISLFLNAKNKVFNVSKNFHYKFLRVIGKKVLLDNDKQVSTSIKDLLEQNCKLLNCKLIESDIHFFKPNEFKNKFLHNNLFDWSKKNFLLFHYDEKWEIDNYSKNFSKASSFTDININENKFFNFISRLSEKKLSNILITTGTIDTKIINYLKNKLIKINESLYELNLNDKKLYLFINQNFFEIAHLISKSSAFISCHGAFTHIASNYKIKIIDIIEKEKLVHYNRITNHMKNYNYVYRDDFDILSNKIISNL